MSHEPADILRAYSEAIKARDIGAFMDLYDENALIYDSFGQWVFRGPAEWRESVVGWFEAMPHGGFGEPHNVVVHAGDTVAGIAADINYGGFNAEGELSEHMFNRFTATLGRDSPDRPWRILVEHTSLPLAMEGMRPIFKDEA